MLHGKHSEGATKFLYIIIVNTALYPFAKSVYDEVAGYFIGDRIYITGVFFVAVIRFIVYWFAIFLAPFYLLFLIPNALNFIKNKQGG